MRTLSTLALVGLGSLAVIACVQQRWIVPITAEPHPTWATHVIPAASNGVLVAGQAQQSDEILAQFHYYFAEAPLKNNLLDSQEGLIGLPAGVPFIDRYSASGERLWRWQLNPQQPHTSFGVLALDEAGDGHIYATDFAMEEDIFEAVPRLHKLNAAGELQWSVPMPETIPFDGSFLPMPEIPLLVKAIDNGPVLVGYITSRLQPTALQAFSADGEFLWQFAGFGAPYLISHGERGVLEWGDQRIVTFFSPAKSVADPEWDDYDQQLADARLTLLDHAGNVLRQASLTELGFNRLDDMARVDDRLYLLGTNATESRLISIDDQFQIITTQVLPLADAARLDSHGQRLCYALIRNGLFHLNEPDWLQSDAVLLGAINGRQHWQQGREGEPMMIPALQASAQGCAYTDMTKAGLNDPQQSVRTVLFNEQGKVNVVNDSGVLAPYPVSDLVARQGRSLYSLYNRMEADSDGQLRARAYLHKRDIW